MSKVTEVQEFSGIQGGTLELVFIDQFQQSDGYFNDLDFTPDSDTVYLSIKSWYGPNSATDFGVAVKMLDQFTDVSNIHEEHIDELSYNRFECLLCMSGPEESLYTHSNSSRIHFHKECYQELREAITEYVEANKEELVVNEI